MTTVLWFHPEHDRSRAGRALVDAASAVPGVEVVDMQALYPTLADLDVEAETVRLLAARRLVLQFPVHWYAAPPLLAHWQNTVLTRMFYVRPDEEGARIAGLPLLVAATAGNTPDAYAPDGANGFPLEDLLHPLAATARRCALAWETPFLLYRANRLDEGERAAAGRAYAERLGGWTATKPGGEGR